MGAVDILIPFFWFAYFVCLGFWYVELAAKKTWQCVQYHVWDYAFIGVGLILFPFFIAAVALLVAIQGVSDGVL